MSDQLQVAAALRRMDDLALVKLARVRSINTTHLRDFFDLADAVTAPKSAAAAIASLSNRQIDALLAILNGTKPDSYVAEELVELALVDKNKSDRDSLIKGCAQALCLQRYGNAACNTPAK